MSNMYPPPPQIGGEEEEKEEDTQYDSPTWMHFFFEACHVVCVMPNTLGTH